MTDLICRDSTHVNAACWLSYPELMVQHPLILCPDAAEVSQLAAASIIQVALQLLQSHFRPLMGLALVYWLGCQQIDPIINPFRRLVRRKEE